MTDPGPAPHSPSEFRALVRRWLEAERPQLPPPADRERDFGRRLAGLRELQAALFEAGWARYGWPPEVGGVGGDARHRAVLYEELAEAGYGVRSAFEHVEVLVPTLIAHWPAPEGRAAVEAFLSGRELWCQGFSEPEAGSDLGALRTRAVADGEGFRIRGRKIWTSWAPFADRCLLLARTGPPEERHRSLSMFAVPVRSAGVEVMAIKQANGLDELAEVIFDDVAVPRSGLVGGEGGGWAVALDVLLHERAGFPWLRQAWLHTRLDDVLAAKPDAGLDTVADVILDLFAARCAASTATQRLARGELTGPEAAPIKVLLTDAEQALFNLVDAADPRLALGSTRSPEIAAAQEEYLFSKATSIYGGARQMQLGTIARYVLGVGTEKGRS